MDREPTSSCWWSLTNRRHWQTRNPASGPTRSALPRASRSPSAYRTRRTARLVCHRGSDLDLCLGRGSFACLGASRFYLGVPGSSRGSVHWDGASAAWLRPVPGALRAAACRCIQGWQAVRTMGDITDAHQESARARRFDPDPWVRPLCPRGCWGRRVRVVRPPAGVRVAGRSGWSERLVAAALGGWALAVGHGRPAAAIRNPSTPTAGGNRGRRAVGRCGSRMDLPHAERLRRRGARGSGRGHPPEDDVQSHRLHRSPRHARPGPLHPRPGRGEGHCAAPRRPTAGVPPDQRPADLAAVPLRLHGGHHRSDRVLRQHP